MTVYLFRTAGRVRAPKWVFSLQGCFPRIAQTTRFVAAHLGFGLPRLAKECDFASAASTWSSRLRAAKHRARTSLEPGSRQRHKNGALRIDMQIGLPISNLQIALTSLPAPARMETCPVLEVPIAITTMESAIQQVNQWIATGSRAHTVTFVNAHMAVEAQLRPEFRKDLQEMDLNCPDGAPIFWLARRASGPRAGKISGPEFMPQFCAQSVAPGHRHFLYGGVEGVAENASKALQELYPGIQIAGHYCPPFRPLADFEKMEIAEMINASGADVVWVCLGCPKQEQWMAEMRDHLQAKAVLAVGQALDILAGRTNRAPAFLRNHGGEWAYRLFKEPRRLWKRYMVTNSLFLLFVLRERLERGRHGEASANANTL